MHKHSEIVDLLLKDNKLILDPSLVKKLKAEPGDRIEIGYRERDGLLRPIISIGENGNKNNDIVPNVANEGNNEVSNNGSPKQEEKKIEEEQK